MKNSTSGVLSSSRKRSRWISACARARPNWDRCRQAAASGIFSTPAGMHRARLPRVFAALRFEAVSRCVNQVMVRKRHAQLRTHPTNRLTNPATADRRRRIATRNSPRAASCQGVEITPTCPGCARCAETRLGDPGGRPPPRPQESSSQRAIVENENLDISICLGQGCLDRLLQIARPIKSGNNDADESSHEPIEQKESAF